MRNHYSACLLLCVLTVFAVSGCNRGPTLPPAVPVGGTVTLDGKPFAGATVRFTPIGETKGTGATGGTDANGKYEVSDRNGNKGAAMGDYRVTIYLANMSPVGPRLSEKYSSAEKSILRAKVVEGGCTIDFPLKSRP